MASTVDKNKCCPRQWKCLECGSLWKSIICKYYLGAGNLTEEDVISEAHKGKDEKEIQERLCESYYFLGDKKLMTGFREDAERYFTKCIDTGAKHLAEYEASETLLQLMKEKRI